jgi:hypothetical protein
MAIIRAADNDDDDNYVDEFYALFMSHFTPKKQ